MGQRSKALLYGLVEKIIHLYVDEHKTLKQITEIVNCDEKVCMHHDSLSVEAVRTVVVQAKEQALRNQERVAAARVILESAKGTSGTELIESSLTIVSGFLQDAVLSMQGIKQEDILKLMPSLLKIGDYQCKISEAKLKYESGINAALALLKDELKDDPELWARICDKAKKLHS